MNIHNKEIKGVNTDHNSRCNHYHSVRDIIAIKFKCCNTYYSCIKCHEALADHKPIVWEKQEFDHRAILCGVCGKELTINEYMHCHSKCPYCHSNFNPGCETHYHLYFEMR